MDQRNDSICEIILSIFGILISILIAFVVTKYGYVKSDNGCDGTGWIEYRDDKCYKLVQQSVKYNEAKDICASSRNWFSFDSTTPQLVSIKSDDEQDYLTKLISEFKVNVWIGAKLKENKFEWNDDDPQEDIDFSNWNEENPTDENTNKKCISMQSDGKWTNVNCEESNCVICEKLQKWSYGKLQKTLLKTRKRLSDAENQLMDSKNEQKLTNQILSETKYNLVKTNNDLAETKNDLIQTKNDLIQTKNDLIQTKNDLTETKNNLIQTKHDLDETKNDLIHTKNELSKTSNELTQTLTSLSETKNNLINTQNDLSETKNQLTYVRNNPVPIGFVYVQLPNQPEPRSLWPENQEWGDVTSAYAGLFFRAEGGGSNTFGAVQDENAPRVTDVRESGPYDNGFAPTTLHVGAWSSGIGVYSGGSGGRNQYGHLFLTSGGEVRPRNMAMRIWKRIN